ncbi:pre-rRNA-processing protein esf1 [Tulasnella sp. 403]|nr:pre-rRNA-processing protein esf1 [Tulasnella sp. 403]
MPDARFARLRTDPRFRKPRKDQHKVVVDERFKSLFTEPKGKGKGKDKGDNKSIAKSTAPRIDKYGRRISANKESADLRRFYQLEGGDDQENEAGFNGIEESDDASSSSDAPQRKPRRPDYARGEALLESSSDESDGDRDSDEDEATVIKLGPVDYRHHARESDSDSDSDLGINLDESEFADLDAQAEAAVASSSKPKAKGVGFGEQARTTAKGEETSRLAVVNLDWDYVKAAHLFKVFASAAALMGRVDDAADGSTRMRLKKSSLSADGRQTGKIVRVRVYPSEFGKARMAKEEVEGPPKEIFGEAKQSAMPEGMGSLLRSGEKAMRRRLDDDEEDDEEDDDDDDDDDDDEDDDDEEDDLDVEEINEKTIYHQEDADDYDQDALRKYQLERLRYFYAIVECDSPKTAAFIYQELDGTELEHSANLLDLSFVPDGMLFDGEFRDEATQDLGHLKPLDFQTDVRPVVLVLRPERANPTRWQALQHSKVKLTWDDDDKERALLTRRTLTQEEIDHNDFKAYLASSASESESEPDNSDARKPKDKVAERDRLRGLLLGGGSTPKGNNDDFFTYNDDLPDGWGGSGKNRAEDIEITFTPGFSTAAADEGDQEVTTLDQYRKKMKEKKKARLGKLEDKHKKTTATGEDGEDDAQGVTKDDFFDAPSSSPSEDEDTATKRKSKKPTKPTARVPSTPAELALLASTDIQSSSEPKHFDMAKVLKAEKDAKKKKKYLEKKKGDDGEEEDGRGFEINVQDERFKALHDEYEYAIDPSNPHFKKTKAMTRLLDERRKRLKDKVREGAEQRTARRHTATADSKPRDAGGDSELRRLVQSVKRKTGDAASAGGRGAKKQKR